MPNTVIILEGPDGAGKTTLARKLAERLRGEILHEAQPPRDCDRLRYYTDKLLVALGRTKPVIFDRFHLGELTYAPVMRLEHTLSQAEMLIMRRLCGANRVPIVICAPPFEVCYENYLARRSQGKEYVDRDDKFRDIYHRFVALQSYHVGYDYTRDEDTQYEGLLAHVHSGRFIGYNGMIGSPNARFLVIGERPTNDLDLPFFGMTRSSGFLNYALWDAGFCERDLAFVNAFSAKGRETFPDWATYPVSSLLPRFKIAVALGNVAQKYCAEYRVPYVPFPHPQYVKRFFHSERSSFVQSLKKLRISTEAS